MGGANALLASLGVNPTNRLSIDGNGPESGDVPERLSLHLVARASLERSPHMKVPPMLVPLRTGRGFMVPTFFLPPRASHSGN
jgi:hypothetical protein